MVNLDTHTQWKDLIDFVGFLFLVSSLIAWLLFARLSMARIEREMKEEGIALPNWDKRAGFRLVSYLRVILWRPQPNKTLPLIDVPATLRLATRRDWFRALWLETSLLGFIVCSVVSGVFFTT